MTYHHLTRQERFVIHRMRIEGFSIAETARALGRHRSTIYREIRRNALGPNCYVWGKAHTRHRRRLHWRRARPRCGNRRLMTYVHRRLRARWSPEQIAGRIQREFPRRTAMRISFMTIYRHIQADKARGGRLWRFLRQARKRKRKRYGSNDQRGHLQGRRFIEERPKAVDAQRRIGDWEADTVWGTTRRAYLATFVERKSLYVLVQRMGQRSAPALNRAAVRAFRSIPARLRKTLTVDNGKEFADFKALEKRLGTRIYFAHPYCSWQRAINENTNGLIRQYIPKKTAIEGYSWRYIKRMVHALNHRPRKKLGYRTPHEVFFQAQGRT